MSKSFIFNVFIYFKKCDKLLAKKGDYFMKTKNEQKIIKGGSDLDKYKKYGILLKRKRIEKKYTLEEVSQGICAPSYLSRIENNLVDVEEKYYVNLFKKFDIDFNKLKEVKEQEIYNELLKCYLLEEENIAVELISDALKTGYYMELEVELMLLYDNIIHGLFSEALNQILDLNEKIHLLIESEFNFYIFLTALYAYRTSQSIYAYRQIVFLCECNFVNAIYQYAVYDLALDIFDFIGANEQFLKYYYLLNNDKYHTLYPKSALKHQAQKIVMESYLNKDEEEVLLYEMLEGSSGKCKEEIVWQILKLEYKKGSYIKCLEIIEKLDATPKLLALESLITLRVNDIKYVYKLEERKKNVTFRVFDESFELMYLACMQIKKYLDYKTAFDIFKKMLKLQNEQTYCAFLFDEQIIMFLEVALSSGKYKEAVKMVMNILKDKLIFPYFL